MYATLPLDEVAHFLRIPEPQARAGLRALGLRVHADLISPEALDALCGLLLDSDSCLTGERLRQRRRLLGLTQPQLGAALGVSKQAIWSWETSRARVPSDLGARLVAIERTQLRKGA